MHCVRIVLVDWFNSAARRVDFLQCMVPAVHGHFDANDGSGFLVQVTNKYRIKKSCNDFNASVTKE